MGYSPWCGKESDTTERLTLSLSPVRSVHVAQGEAILLGSRNGNMTLASGSPGHGAGAQGGVHGLVRTIRVDPWDLAGENIERSSLLKPGRIAASCSVGRR